MAVVRYTESVEIARKPAEVWDLRLDFGRLPEINPNVSGLRRTDGGDEPGVGAAYEFEVTIPGIGTIPAALRVTEAQRPHRIANEMEAGVLAREVCTFEPAGDGTRVAFEVAIEVTGDLDDAARALIEDSGRAQVRLELEGMKRLLEESR